MKNCKLCDILFIVNIFISGESYELQTINSAKCKIKWG